MENRKPVWKMAEIQSWLFEKTHTADRPLARWTTEKMRLQVLGRGRKWGLPVLQRYGPARK